MLVNRRMSCTVRWRTGTNIGSNGESSSSFSRSRSLSGSVDIVSGRAALGWGGWEGVEGNR